jgi:hypothetical protein
VLFYLAVDLLDREAEVVVAQSGLLTRRQIVQLLGVPQEEMQIYQLVQMDLFLLPGGMQPLPFL